MRGPLLLDNRENFLADLQRTATLVRGNLSYTVTFDISPFLSQIVNFLRVRTWLYPYSSIVIIGITRASYFRLEYSEGSLLIEGFSNIRDILFSQQWTPAITSVPSLEVSPGHVRDFLSHFPGVRSVSISVNAQNISALLQAQMENPGITFYPTR